jgi:hypothetical protein
MAGDDERDSLPATEPGDQDEAPAAEDPPQVVPWPLSLWLVRLLAGVVAFGLAASAALVMVCRFAPGPSSLGIECTGAAAGFDRRFSESLQTIVTLLAGKALRPD